MRGLEKIHVRSWINSWTTLILFLILNGVTVFAQDTEFWFVAPHMSETLAGSPATPLNLPAFLAISNATGHMANVTITRYNGTNASLVTNATIAPGALYKLDFTTDADMKTIENPRGSAGNLTEFGIHITSDVKVTAYYMHNHSDSRDIFTLKGGQALGTSFYVPMQSDNAASTSTNWAGACDQIDIVATEDGTVVTITPTTAIRIGASGSSPAGTPLTYTLDRGETLKIMEDVINCNPSLAGTRITASQPVAITVTEDLVGGDTSGDQIVPVSSLGSRYVVPRGYRQTATMERFYLVGTANNTTVTIYEDPANTAVNTTFTLNAGGLYRYDFPSVCNAVYIEASEPVYCYQRTGYNEEGAALLPGIYSIGQNRMSYYQTQAINEKGFLLFRAGAENDFRISYGSTSNAPLNVGTVYDVPNVSDWKLARFDLPPAANDQAVTIENAQSAFSFGYIAANPPGQSQMTLYGYFSAFGEFEFAATTYLCNASTLDGGYAMSYDWTLPDGTHVDTPSVTVTQEGYYTLVMNQDPNIVTTTTFVRIVSAGVIGTAQTVCYGASADPLTETSPATGAQSYRWQSSPNGTVWTDIPGATSSDYSPGTLTATTYFRRIVITDLCGLISSDPVAITVLPQSLLDYPDIRLRVCPATGATVSLSKYIDSTEVTSILWNGISPAIPVNSPAGSIPTDNLVSPGVYTLTYTVKNRCIPSGVTRKAYLEVIRNGNARRSRDTVEICYTQAEAVNINQIFGIEANGTWTFPPAVASYITQSTSPTYGGAVIMDGKRIYEETSIRNVEIIYTPDAGSCLDGKTYKKVIKLYEL